MNTFKNSQIFSEGFTPGGSSTNIFSDTINIGRHGGQQLNINSAVSFEGRLTLPLGSIRMENINGLGTKITSLESSIASQGTKQTSDISYLQLQINNISLAQGPPGATGATGPKGDPGATGATRPKGDTGAPGAQGARGADGVNRINGLNGAKGDRELTRETGATGATRPKGDTGATGPSGASQLGTENTWTDLQTFNSGLTVPTGATITFPANSIPASCITCLSSSGSSSGIGLFTENKTGFTAQYNSLSPNSVGYQYYTGIQNTINGFTGSKTILPYSILWYASGVSTSISRLDCGFEFNPPFGSLWLVEMRTTYQGATAINTNYVDISVTNLGAFSFNTTHVVNFGLNYHTFNDTFTMVFSSSKQLVFSATIKIDVPTGKNYKIANLNLLFTRLA